MNAAVSGRNLELDELPLDRCADIEQTDGEGRTPLIMTCHAWRHNVDIMEMLLAHRAKVNAKTTKGRTTLHAAVEYGNRQCIQLLLESGAGVTAVEHDRERTSRFRDKGSMTPLDIAENDLSKATAKVENSRLTEFVELLRRHGGRTAQSLSRRASISDPADICLDGKPGFYADGWRPPAPLGSKPRRLSDSAETGFSSYEWDKYLRSLRDKQLFKRS